MGQCTSKLSFPGGSSIKLPIGCTGVVPRDPARFGNPDEIEATEAANAFASSGGGGFDVLSFLIITVCSILFLVLIFFLFRTLT